MTSLITLKDFNLGGQADSDFQGNANSLARIVGLDIHSKVGTIRASQALVKESGATVDSFAKVVVPCSNGKSYWFSSTSGKIWERTSVGGWSLVHTNGNGGCLGAFEHNGFIYYATSQYLGRWRISLAWSVAVDSWATFDDDAQDDEFKPMLVKNLVLYIGDSNLVAQVDESETSGVGTISGSGTTITGVGTSFTTAVSLWDRIRFTVSGKTYERVVVAITDNTHLTVESAFSPQPSAASFVIVHDVFTPDALDLPKPYRAKSLGEHLDELLIGTTVSDNVNKTKIFRWDTWSTSFNSDDTIPEVGINAFIPEDNFAMTSGGQKGNIYYYDGRQLQPFKRLRGDWAGTNKATVHPNAVANFNGLPLFGLSNVSGDPTLQGVYSLGAYAANYPKVVSLPYIISENVLAGIEIGAIAILGDNLLVSWKRDSAYGVDKINWSAKYDGGYLETRVIMSERSAQKTFNVNVGYQSLPANTAITIWHNTNNAGFEQAEAVVDTMRKIVYSKTSLPSANTIQFKIVLETDSNNSPEIDSLEITVE